MPRDLDLMFAQIYAKSSPGPVDGSAGSQDPGFAGDLQFLGRAYA
jgi:hypothetical protein